MNAFFHRKRVLRYLYDTLTGNFLGFLVAMSATGMVSRFFETRSVRNLWGLTSKKTIVDKETFSALEWILSIVIGFIVFEVITKLLKEQTGRYAPLMKRRVFRWIVRHNLHKRFTDGVLARRAVFLTAVHTSIRRTFSEK